MATLQPTHSIVLLRITFLLLLAPFLRAASAPEALLVVVGDQHSAYDKYPQFLARIDALRAANPGVPLGILVDGDCCEYGNVVGRRTDGSLDLALFADLAKRGPTVLNLGNHDSDFLGVSDLVARLRAVGVTVISGNLRDRATGQPFAPASTQVKLGHQTLTIVGVTTDRLAVFRIAIRPTLDLSDPVVWARQNFPAVLRDAKLPVVLSHAGLKADRQMLPLVPDGTLFAGAHDHLLFVHREGRTVYFHSGSWLAQFSIATLRDVDGQPTWSVEQPDLAADAPADEALAAKVRATLEHTLTPAETAVVGRLDRSLPPAEAARFAVDAARIALGADAAIIGGTSFGGGLPNGEITRYTFDACVRFDGPLYEAEVSGAELQRVFAKANQGPTTPWAERSGENLVAVGPGRIEPAGRYRLVTTDWIARNAKQYLGENAPPFREQAVRLKAAVLAALGRGRQAK